MQINTELIEFCLDRVTGEQFESFFTEFFSPLVGIEFVPAGGNKDGGSDGFLSPERIYSTSRAGIFYQATIEGLDKLVRKAKLTLAALKKSGRKVNRIEFVVPYWISKPDLAEAKIEDEIGVAVRIHSRATILGNANSSLGTSAAVKNRLLPIAEPLKKACLAFDKEIDSAPANLAVYAYLSIQLDSAASGDSFISALTDSLILLSLDGTGAEKKKFLSSREIHKKIEGLGKRLYAAVKGAVNGRLKHLASVSKSYGRPIGRHGKDKYCLSQDYALKVQRENALYLGIEDRVNSSIQERLSSFSVDAFVGKPKAEFAKIIKDCIDKVATKEGLGFVEWISGIKTKGPAGTLSELVFQEVGKLNIRPNENRDRAVSLVFSVIEDIFQRPGQAELLYLNRLAKAYSLAFIQKADPKVIEHFQKVPQSWKLTIGSDVLIDAILEQFRGPNSRIVRESFKLANHAGARLYLTPPVLEEVVGHFRAADYAYRDLYQGKEKTISADNIYFIPREIHRLYFEIRIASGGIFAWPEFINRIVTYSNLHSDSAYEEVKRYICAEFGMDFLADIETGAGKHFAEVEKNLRDKKADPRLARNDALVVDFVYAERRKSRESSTASQSGFKSWWVTRETEVLDALARIEKEEGGRCLMNPQYMLNYLAFLPSQGEARNISERMALSAAGLELSRRLSDQVIKKILGHVEGARGLDEGRKKTVVSAMQDQLMSLKGKKDR